MNNLAPMLAVVVLVLVFVFYILGYITPVLGRPHIKPRDLKAIAQEKPVFQVEEEPDEKIAGVKVVTKRYFNKTLSVRYGKSRNTETFSLAMRGHSGIIFVLRDGRIDSLKLIGGPFFSHSKIPDEDQRSLFAFANLIRTQTLSA